MYLNTVHVIIIAFGYHRYFISISIKVSIIYAYMFSILLINGIWYIHVALVIELLQFYTLCVHYIHVHMYSNVTGVQTRRKFVESVKTFSVARKRL